MQLNIARARAAIQKHVATPLGMAVEEAAYAVHRVVNANMARAAKVHCLEHGKDPRQFTLFAYGGAGPVHAYGVAQLLGVKELVYPPCAGVMSALGFLVAEPSFEILHGRIDSLMDLELSAINKMLAVMEEEGGEIVRNSVPTAKRLRIERAVAVRYEGQSYELYVPISTRKLNKTGLQSIARNFTKAYGSRYHAIVEQSRLESVRWRVRVSALENGPTPNLAKGRGAGIAAIKGKRSVYVAEAGRFMNCPVYERAGLRIGSKVIGPAIIEEAESTVYLGKKSTGVITSSGDLRVSLGMPSRSIQKANRGQKKAA